MARRNGQKQADYFIFNNCKIANELRKYRDLAGSVNQVSLSGQPSPKTARRSRRGPAPRSDRRPRRPSDAEDWAEYVITRDLTYLDMVTANAVYTLLCSGAGERGFQAETVARLMAGDPTWRITGERSRALEERLCKLAETGIYILADHDSHVDRDLYEGAFLPLEWTEKQGKLQFRFSGGELPLYRYAEDHQQLIRIPASRLRAEGQARRNNTDQALALRHYLLQELAILGYGKNEVTERSIRLLRLEREGREGLLWTLGIQEEDPGPKRVRTVQRQILELLDLWRAGGQLGPVRYQELGESDGFGVRLYTPEAEKTAGEEMGIEREM